MFLVFSVTLNTAYMPFNKHFLNNLESLSLISSSITVYCGLYYISSDSIKADDLTCKISKSYIHFESQLVELDEGTKMTMFTVILCSHVAFFGYWLRYFMIEM
jgi:hypothetical protein